MTKFTRIDFRKRSCQFAHDPVRDVDLRHPISPAPAISELFPLLDSRLRKENERINADVQRTISGGNCHGYRRPDRNIEFIGLNVNERSSICAFFLLGFL